MELRFRPEDPYSHPAFGELRSSTGLLLRLCKPRGGEHASRGGACEGGHSAEPPPAESLSAEVVARVNHAYHFEGGPGSGSAHYLFVPEKRAFALPSFMVFMLNSCVGLCPRNGGLPACSWRPCCRGEKKEETLGAG